MGVYNRGRREPRNGCCLDVLDVTKGTLRMIDASVKRTHDLAQDVDRKAQALKLRVERLERAVNLLCDGDQREAYRVMIGLDD